MYPPGERGGGVYFWTVLLLVFGIVKTNFINFKPGYEYEYKLESTSSVKNIGEFQLKSKVGYINVGERADGQEILVRVRTFRFSQASSPHTVGHDLDFNKWFSFVINRHGEIQQVFYHTDEDEEVVAIKKGMAAMFAARLHQEDGDSMEKTEDGWKYHVQELGHEGRHNATYKVEPHSQGKKFTKTRDQHPLAHAKSDYTKTLYYNDDLGTIHTVDVSEQFSAMKQSVPGYEPFEGQRPTKAVNDFSDIEYPEMKAFGKGKLEFISQHKLAKIPNRKNEAVISDSIHIDKINSKPIRSNSPKLVLEDIRGNLTIMRNQPEKTATQEMTNCFHNLMTCIELLDDDEFIKVTDHYLNLTPHSTRNEKDRNHILDAVMGTGTERAQTVVTEKILSNPKPDQQLILRLLVHIISMDDVPVQKLMSKLFELGLEPSKSPILLREGDVYHRVLLTIGSVARKLNQEGRHQEASQAVTKIEQMLGYHDPYVYRKKRSVMTEWDIQLEDTWKVNLLGALGNARMDQSFEYIVSHINSTNCQWIKRAGIHALRGYHHDHVANLMLHTAKYDEHDTVRYEALLQYQAHPSAKLLTPFNTNSSYNGSSMYFNPWDINSQDVAVHSRNKRGFLDKGFEFVLKSPSLDFKKMLGSMKIGASFGILMKNMLDLKISALSGHAIVDVHDEAFARVHLGVVGINLDFFLARVCFKGNAEYNINLLQEFGIDNLKDLVKLYDKIKNEVVGEIKKGIDLFKGIIKGDISIGDILEEFKKALEDLPKKVIQLSKKAVGFMKKIGELSEADLPPFFRPIRRLVGKVVDLLNDIRKDVMGFYNQLLETVTIIIPRAGKQIYTAIKEIIKAFKDFNNDPKNAISNVGKNVLNIGLEIKNLIDAVNKTKNSLTAEKPYWFDITKQFDELWNLVKDVKDGLKNGGKAWIDQKFQKGKDPVAAFTNGKFSMAQIRQQVVDDLKLMLDDLLKPFDPIKNLGGEFLKRFKGVFQLVDTIKDAFNKLKEGYRTARSLIDRLFGPKCHKSFPKKYRTPGSGCDGSGFYPSELKKPKEYDIDGVDLLKSRGSKIVAPFPGYIKLSPSNDNEVIITATGGSLKDTDIILTNIKANGTILLEKASDYTRQLVKAGQVIGEVTDSQCGIDSDHIHFAMRQLKGGIIDPTRYVEPRIPSLPKWVQECDDYKLVWKFDVVSEGTIIGINGKENKTETPERNGGTIETPPILDQQDDPAKVLDNGLFGGDSMFGKVEANKNKVDQKTKNTKDSGFKNFFKRPAAFLEKFSIRKLKMGAILDLLDILGLDESKQSMAAIILKIKEIIDNKPCFNPYQMSTDQLRTELTERGMLSEGSRETMIKILTTPSGKCAALSFNLPKNVFCTFDEHCLGIECCVHLKVFMFLKTYKLYARFDPCDLKFVIGIEDKFEKSIGGFDGIYGDVELDIKPGIKIDLLDGLELIIRLKFEKTESVALGTVGVGFCPIGDPENCLPFLMLMDESILPLPICAPDGTLTWPEVNWKEYYSRDAIKKRLKESAKKLSEEAVEYGLQEALKKLGIPEDLLEETPPCPRPEILTNEILKERLERRGLITTGSSQQMRDRLTQAEKTCKIFDKTLTLPAIKNQKLNKLIYLQISENCMHLQACVDIQIRTKLFNFTKAFKSYVKLDTCNFLLHVGFEKYTHSVVLIGYEFGTEETIPIGDAILLKFKLDKNSEKKIFIVDFALKIKFANEDSSIDSKLIEGMEIPIPICNENFTLPGGGSVADFAKAMGGKLSQAAVEVIFQKLGLNKIFSDGQCQVAPSPTDCPWNIDVEQYLPAKVKDSVTCGMPDNCFGLHCCVDFQFKIPFVDEPIQKSVLVFLEFDPCNFVLTVGFGSFKHTETLLSYEWGKPSSLTIGNGKLAPITISYTISKYTQGFIIDLNVLACIPIDGTPFCFPEEGLDLMKAEKIPACDARALSDLANSNLSLSDYFKEVGAEAGKALAKSGANFLLQKLGISQYLLENRCDVKREPYSSNIDGWNNDCQKPIKKLPKLPKGLICHISESCTKIDCCFSVGFLDMSFHAFLNIDMCDYFIEAAIEKKHIKLSLFSDDFNLDKGITDNVKISDYFVVEFGVRKVDKTFLLDLAIKVCFEKDKCQEEFPVLVGTEIPQFICDLNAKLDFNFKNFSITDWAKEKGLEVGQVIAKKAVQVFLQQTGLADKMLNPPCSRDSLKYQPEEIGAENWKNDCPKVKNLPTIKVPANCYIPDYCTGVDCCLHSNLLDLSINAYLNIDTCKYVIEGAIEKFGFKINIVEYAWGEEKEEKLSEFIYINFKIDRLLEDKIFIVDLSIKMCWQGSNNCEIELPVFVQNRIPMPFCNMEMGFKFKDFSMKNWLAERGGDITAILANQLMDYLGLTKFLKDDACSFVSEPFKTATLNNGWNKECPLNMTLPVLPDKIACYIPDYCTGVSCCVDVPEVRRTFQAHLLIDTCNYEMSVGIEKVVFNVTLWDYKWGTEQSVDIGGMFKLTFTIEDLEGEKQFLVNVKLSACFSAGEKCSLEIPVFTDMRVPKILCDWEATLAIKDFKLDDWLLEQGGQITDTVIDKLLQKYEISSYLKSPMCNRNTAPFKETDNGWNNECKLNMSLPALPSDIVCHIPDYCTGISCCLEVAFLRRSFQAQASINMCSYVLTVGIEELKFKKSLLKYDWGKPAHFNLKGRIRIDYIIENFEGDKEFILSMNMSVCLSSDKPCTPSVKILENARIPKLFCDWDATTSLTSKGFILDEFLQEQKAKLGDALSELTFSRLFEALNISRFLLKPQCNKDGAIYSPANSNGWKYECPINNLDFGKLPSYAKCRIPDFCTGIDCCVEVPVIGYSFNIKVYLNACDYYLTISIEKLVFKKTLFNYQWGTQEQFNINGVVGIEFVIDNLEGAKQYMISLSATFCFDSPSTCLTVSILKEARVPKILCDWESDYKAKDFSLTNWLTEKGLQVGNEMSSMVLSRLYNELGIAAYLLDTPCDPASGMYSGSINGWKDECKAIPNLPTLPNDVTCHLPNTCDGIQCCVYVPRLKRSFESFIRLNPCDFTFRVGIEKYQFNRNLIDYKWGTKEHLTLKDIVRADFMIDDMNSDKKFLVNLNISICLEKDKSCLVSVPVLTNTKIPKLLCDWESTLALKDFSLSNWLSEQKADGAQKLTSTLRAKLYEQFKIAGYMRQTECQRSKEPFSSTNVNGWTNACPSTQIGSLLPNLPAFISCHLGSRCTHVECCTDVDFLGQSFYFLIDVNMCDYTLTVAIENLSYKRKLFSYKWGEEDHFYLKGVVRVDYLLTRLDGEKAIEMSVKISVCLQETTCLFEKQILNKKQVPQPLCEWKKTLAASSFSLKGLKLKEGLPSTASLTDIFISKLLEKSGISDYLNDPACDRESQPYIPYTANYWKKDCPKQITLPGLPETTRCHWSTDCSSIDCCVYIGLIKRTVNIQFSIDVCNLEMTLVLGKLHYKISLFDYKWGVEGVFHINGRVRLYYTLVNNPSKTITIDLRVKVCFEDATCLTDIPILQQIEISYSPCDLTKPAPFKGVTFDFWSLKSCSLNPPSSGCSISLPQSVSEICHFNDKCQGITCCVKLDLKYLGTYSLAASFNLDHCSNKLTYSLENKKWEKTLLSIPLDKNITEAVGDAIEISYVVSDTGGAYVVSLHIKLCTFNIHQNKPYCKYWMLLDKKSFVKPGCGRRKRRSVIKEISKNDYEVGLKELIGRDATNSEIKAFMDEVKNNEATTVEQNLFPDWNDGGQANNVRSALKTMGSSNPSTILYTSNSGKVTVGIEGSEEMFKILNTVSGVLDNVEQAFIVGKGLTGAGVKLLGAKLSNMTIGEIMAFVDTKNIDPEKALELVKELRNLALALYSEILDAVLTGNAVDTFKSLDFTLQGDFSFPRQELMLFKYSIFFLLGGIIPMNFRFGAGCTYGMQIIVGGKIMKMIAFGGATPYGGVLTYGELNVGFILYGGLRLEGYIMTTSFPTRAEIGFAKFPLDIKLTMDIELIPLRLRLLAIVTLRIKLVFVTIKKTLFQATLWQYSTPVIRKRLIDFGKDEKDSSPPVFSEYTDKTSGRKKRAAGLPVNTVTRECSVRQLPGRDYTEPAIEISARSEDDKSQVNLFLTAGTKPGLADALPEIQLGGPSSVITTKLKHNGVPIYFTLVGRNSGGGSNTVTCSIPTYDISLPGGRFSAEFITSSNPRVLKASVVVFEDSELEYSSIGVGVGRGIYGDEMEHWKPIKLGVQGNKNYDINQDTHGYLAKAHFTGDKKGRLIAPVAREFFKINYVEACLKKCMELPESKCLSVNYDFGTSGHCELLEAIEGHDHQLAVSGKYTHLERLGVGLAYEFSYDDKKLKHNIMYYFNLDLKNFLGYRNIISTKGVLIDLTTPTPGEGLMNSTSDIQEKIPCSQAIPSDRPEWALKCIGQSDVVFNHRTIIDGEGSKTVFNGHSPLLDLKYFRANRFLSANWDGIHDKQTGLLGYSFTAGRKYCEELIHPHHDPHKHLFDESEWTHTGIIKKDENDPIPDGKYFVTVRALNKVEYGGPLVTSFCHSTPYVIDNSVPFVHEVFNVQYDEDSKDLSTEYNATDPESDIKEVDICLGQTTKDCYIMDWMTYPHSGQVIHNTELPGGIPIWVKIKAWNNVNISAVKSSDHPLIIDTSPPTAGEVYDGPLYKHDLMYTKDSNKICMNWVDFYDKESGISYFSAFVRSAENDVYLTNGTDYDHRTHKACIDLDGELLQHGKSYYIELWAFNAGHKQLNVSAKSDGVVVDLTVPPQGEIIDGVKEQFVDTKFSAATATIASQWRGHSDPESNIKSYEVQILRAKNISGDFEILRDWHILENTTESIEWHNFHLHHRDSVKTKLRTTNGALGAIVEETDGYIVDLTPPTLIYLNDGNQAKIDIDYQSSENDVMANFEFVDEESGIDHYKYQVYQMLQGSKHQIHPAEGEWTDLTDATAKSLTVGQLSLKNGARYSVRIGAVNRANAVATYDTNGFLLDKTPPTMHWVHVGVFNGENEEEIDGFVLQADKGGIKATWFATDDVSGIREYHITIGTTEGGNDIMASTSFGSDRDRYIDGLSLLVNSIYYVSVKATNGAGLECSWKTSTPIKVVEEDKAGIVNDGANGTDQPGSMGLDIDYQRETGTVTVQFSGYESTLHGISRFDWAVGTSAGGEEVQPFMQAGLIHEESSDIPGNGIASSGFGQAILPLESGKTYYSTVRGITNVGNVLESTSDGFTVDTSPPIITLQSLSEVIGQNNLTEGLKIYQAEVDSLSASWLANDTQSGIHKMWYSVGTFPDGSDIQPATEVSVFLNGEASLPVGETKPTTDGKPNIINIWAVNKVGLTGKATSATLIVDTSPPVEGIVTCPTFIQPHSPLKCTWDGFVDAESPIIEFTFGLGSAEGLVDIVTPVKLPGHMTSHLITDLVGNVSHGKSYFAMVTAKNAVGKSISAVSNSIKVDVTPPVVGKVVELRSEYIINVTSDRSTSELNSYSCNTDDDCNNIDAVCQESLTSINIAWSAFTDKDTDIVQYEVAVGTTPGGGQVKPFFNVPLNKRYMTIKNVMLKGLRQVFVTVKATNDAGLSTISTSNGIYLSYISQEMEPLSHIGVWDGDSLNGDIDFQTDLDTIRSRWDVSGDPCPVIKYEWAIERIDGKRVQEFTDTNGQSVGINDKLSMKSGERYYILLRVTTAGGYKYILRSNGVTVEEEPLIPGQVNDGDVIGYDLNFVYTKKKVSANWDGFGRPLTDSSNAIKVDSGNPGVQVTGEKNNQDIDHYEVAVGKDRRFPKTRDNVVPFTNVGSNTSVTFFDLDLVPLTATYYFTVRAYSKSFSMAEVTSNGFQVGYDDGVTAGTIGMPDYAKNDTVLDVQWDGFESKVGMLMYYIALSTNNNASKMKCKQFIEGGDLPIEERVILFDLRDIENVGKDTFIQVTNLNLKQNNGYYVTIVGVDKAGECNLTSFYFHVDITPPDSGQVKVGPYYNMKMSFAPSSEFLMVEWKDFKDDESGIKCFRISLIQEGSCQVGAIRTVIVPSIELDENSTSYEFLGLDLKPAYPYLVKLEIENKAGLVIIEETSPVLYDISQPTAGHVVDGHNFKKDVVWSKSSSIVKGSILQLPTPDGLPCPTRNMLFTESLWKRFESKVNYDSSGKRLELDYRTGNVFTDSDNQLEIKLARDVKSSKMFSGAYYRGADLVNGGKYEMNIQAANGNGKAVTSILFWDGPESSIIDYDYTKELDWTLQVCSCCKVNKDDPACTKVCNCKEFLESKKKVKRSTTNSTSDQPSYVKDLSAEERADMVSKNPKDMTEDTPAEELESHRSCGIQLLAGESQKIITWCKFKDNLNRPMKTERKLTFDPSASINNYRIEFVVRHEEETEVTWCLQVFVNNEMVSALCGIPQFSIDTRLFFHVWNWKNYLPPLPSKIEDMFNVWSTRAIFTDLVMPPEKSALCRYGNPFRGGTNAIIRYEAGIGRIPKSDSVVAFREVLKPCVPCRVPCDRYSCQPSCESNKFTQYNIILDSLNLPPTETVNATVNPIPYYLSVKAVLGSGKEVISSSNGFYIDVSKPVFDTDAMLYIDVAQGNFTPVSYQGSNDTIRSIWLCSDEESSIVEYQWGIGRKPGVLDIQDFMSTGQNPAGTNTKLLGILQDNTTYYVTVKCINGAGLETIHIDQKGVRVLLFPPDITDVMTNMTGSESFDKPISPPNAMKTDGSTIGCSWTVSEDPSITEYDFCVGSSETKCNDIFPCTWVGYNISGEVTLKDGWLNVDGYPVSPIGTFNPNYNDTTRDNGTTGFKMEPGRTLFLCMKMCNEANKCTTRNIGSSVIVDSKSKIATSTNGESVKISLGSSTGRKKREVNNVIIETPSGLEPGQSILFSELTKSVMEVDYRSDASTEFISFITNPSITLNNNDNLHRLLINRLTPKNTDKHFTVSSIGHNMMPGPLVITVTYDPLTIDNDKLPMLIHWNPVQQKFELSKTTCKNEIGTEIVDQSKGEIKIKVCDTWAKSEPVTTTRKRRAVGSDTYFSQDTQFMVTDVLKVIPNSPPQLTTETSLKMNEDGGTIVYQLAITDAEGDEVTFMHDSSSTQNLGSFNLTSQGLLLFLPCQDCFGELQIPINITEIQAGDIPPATTQITMSITITPINDAPAVFMLSDNTDILLSDPTEPVVILLQQNREGQNDTNMFKWTFGVYDVDTNDNLRLFIDRPLNGSVKISAGVTTPPSCDNNVKENMLPCKDMTLPHSVGDMTWLYYTMTYEPKDGVWGYDDIRLFITDSLGLSSDVVTVKMAMMIMPCINGGTCQSKNVNATYTCENRRRAEDFYDYYSCMCLAGWTGSRCHEDVDECDSSPCAWPYICYNYQNRYQCACPLDEPNCDSLVGWMIALIVIAVFMVIVISLLIFYICIVRRGRVKWSHLFNRFGSDKSQSDNNKHMIFDNSAYSFEPDEQDDSCPEPSNGGSNMVMFNRRHQYDGLSGPMNDAQFISVPGFQSTSPGLRQRQNVEEDGELPSSSVHFGPSTFNMSRNSPQSSKSGSSEHSRLVLIPKEANETESPYKVDPYPDYD